MAQSNRRTDEQLEAILAETGDWVVNGRQPKVICHAPSLQVAIDRAATYAALGMEVRAVCRWPAANIIVFPPQIERLRKTIAGRETLPIKETDDYRMFVRQ